MFESKDMGLFPICGDELGCGGKFSFPLGWNWRSAKKSADYVKSGSSLWPNFDSIVQRGEERVLVLVRDPVAAKASAMSRFAMCGAGLAGSEATFYANNCKKAHYSKLVDRKVVEAEALALELGLKKIEQLASKLRCDRTLIIAYELLTANPEAHRNALAAFWNINPTDPRLSSYLKRLKAPASEHSQLSAQQPAAPIQLHHHADVHKLSAIGQAIMHGGGDVGPDAHCPACPAKQECRTGADCGAAWERRLQKHVMTQVPNMVPRHP